MDFGLSQSDMESIQGGLDPSGATGGTAPSQQDQDNYAQASADVIASPIAGDRVGRSNIIGSVNYDPTFAQALNISRGLLPGNIGGGFNQSNIPSSLLPQVQSDLFPEDMYYSKVDRFLGETAPELVRNYMEMGIGGLLNKFTSAVSSTANSAKEALSGGIDYLKNSLDGLSLEDINKSVNDAVSNLVPNRVETDTNPMNMPMSAIRDEVPKVSYGEDKDGKIPTGFTFGSMPEQTMNTGIAGLSSAPVTVDKLSPIVQEIEDPIDQIVMNQREADFRSDVLDSIRNRKPKDSFNQDFIMRSLNKEPFKDEGTFINLDNI